MITFSPNGDSLKLTTGQWNAVRALEDAADPRDLEVVELESGAIEVYVGDPFEVGDSYHRWYIDIYGKFASPVPEYAVVTCVNGEWGWEW